MELCMTTLTLLSSLAEPPVTVVDKVVKLHGTDAVSKAYLDYLYSDEGGASRRQASLLPRQPGDPEGSRSPAPAACPLY